MNILIITAHPSKTGFVHKIKDVCEKSFYSKGYKVETIDLYEDKWKQDYLAFENPKEIPFDPKTEDFKRKITEANHLIFIHPVWWTSIPAVMKNFLDINFSARFAFMYTPEGKPVGLLKGKTGSVFMTCGATGMISLLLKIFLYVWWDKAMLGFCGIKIKDFSMLSGIQKRTDEEKDDFLKKVETSILKY